MRYFLLILCIFISSCQKDEILPIAEGPEIEQPEETETETETEGTETETETEETEVECETEPGFDCIEEDCDVLEPYAFSVTPVEEGLAIGYGPYLIIDAFGKVCRPDSLDFYIAGPDEPFQKLKRVVAEPNGFLVDDIEMDVEYRIKMVNVHCELSPIAQPIQFVSNQEIPLPEFIYSPALFEDFRLSPDGDQYIYRNSSNDWYARSFSSPFSQMKFAEEAFYGQWNPHSDSQVAFVQQTRVDITPSLQGIASEALWLYDVQTETMELLHEIEFLMDFGSDHKPEQYWIHEFHFSLDGNSIYFVSNKDNGSSSLLEKKVYDNIWKIDLQTKELEMITDFLPTEFEMHDFVEDPKDHGNFYLLGATYGEMVDAGGFINMDRVDVHYYDAGSDVVSPIFISDQQEEHISIDPTGENLTFVSTRTGGKNIWRYKLSNQSLRQVTNRALYTPTYRWHHINWISDYEFMTAVKHEDEKKFAVFNVE